jgi:hypothetical protein
LHFDDTLSDIIFLKVWTENKYFNVLKNTPIATHGEVPTGGQKWRLALLGR